MLILMVMAAAVTSCYYYGEFVQITIFNFRLFGTTVYEWLAIWRNVLLSHLPSK